MALRYTLSPTTTLILEPQAYNTTLTLSSHSPGQQQQASTSFATGAWTAEPVVYRLPERFVVRLYGAEGEHLFEVTGGSVRKLMELPPLEGAETLPAEEVAEGATVQPMKPMPPMKPMQPLKMGDMEMDSANMTMRMGDMTMGETPPQGEKRFCSQCGEGVAPEDKFCSHCGYQLRT